MRYIAGTIDAMKVDKVLLNGEEMKLVREVDTEKGEIVRYRTDSRGKLVHVNGLPQTETLRGAVEIRFKEET